MPLEALHLSATDLSAHAGQAALAHAGLGADKVDEVLIGNVIQTSPDACYLARHAGLGQVYRFPAQL